MQRQCFAITLPFQPAIIGKNPLAFQYFLRPYAAAFTSPCWSTKPVRFVQMYRPVRFEEGVPRTGFATSSHRRHESSSGNITRAQKDGQTRTPWHKEGSDLPPATRPRPAEPMQKGKLLTTPSRLLKLIIPLAAVNDSNNANAKDTEPLALLVHPQQPLSYLERLIQFELPPIGNASGKDKLPAIYFKAQEFQQDAIEPRAKHEKRDDTAEDMHEDAIEEGKLEETKFDGKMVKTGKVDSKAEAQALDDRSRRSKIPSRKPDNQTAESHSNVKDESKEIGSRKFVRWSTSTDIGDFIRDAARGEEFEIEIEGVAKPIRIGVPSFNDRTHYLRLRLRRTASKIIDLAAIKKECDMAAHKGAQRVAVAGAGVLMGYWYVVYRLTFETDLGWDTMEPVTYLVGLSTLICGYLWFLYHNREVSYRSAMNLTISRRQDKLYQAKGFDNHKWKSLIEEANGYRREIKQIASEYDVEWDETEDEKDAKVTEAMRKVRSDKKNERKEKRDGDDDDED